MGKTGTAVSLAESETVVIRVMTPITGRIALSDITTDAQKVLPVTDRSTAAIKMVSLTVTDTAGNETVRTGFLAEEVMTATTGMAPVVDCSAGGIGENPTTEAVCSAAAIMADTTAVTVVLAVGTTMVDTGAGMVADADRPAPAVGRFEA